MKLHLGCGSCLMPGWMNIDKYNFKADMQLSVEDLNTIKNNSVEKIYTSHMIEHLPRQVFHQALLEWNRVLKDDGKLIIRCPDASFYLKAWLERGLEYRVNIESLNCILGIQDRGEGLKNRNLFSPDLLEFFLVEAGFTIEELKLTSKRTIDLYKKLQNGLEDTGVQEGDKLTDIFCIATKTYA